MQIDAKKIGEVRIALREVRERRGTRLGIKQEKRQAAQKRAKIMGVVNQLFMILRRKAHQPSRGAFQIGHGSPLVLESIVNNQDERWQQRQQN